MNKVLDKYNNFHNPKVLQAGRIFFYLGLLFEIVIFILDRADWINPYQSYMFRITFIFFLIKCICTKYDKKQAAFIIITAAFSILIYLCSGKDETVRVMTFIIAMKDMDLKRTLRFDYFGMCLGIAILGLLSIFGILGEVIATPGYGDKENAFMLAFGLGSSNTWAIQIWVLVLLAIYLYHDRLKKYTYLIMFAGGIVLYALSRTSTALIMFTFTSLGAFILVSSEKIRKSKITYIAGAVIVLLCTGFSVFAAKISKWWDFQPDWQRKLDTILTGRITSLYAFENGGAVLSNWKLFGSRIFTQSFDMGIVRLFWWYGIIPGVLCILAVLFVIYDQYKHEDHMGLLLTVSMTIFSVFEAHFVSVFICRSYFIFILGSIWYRYLTDGEQTQRSVAFYIGSLNKGGAERVFCNLAEYFVSAGYRTVMITQYKKDNEYELPDGVTRVISDITQEESGGRLHNMFARLLKLHRILLEADCDLLMTTVNKNNFNAILATAFMRTRAVVSIVADPAEEYYNRSLRIGLRLLFPEADGIIMQTTQSLKFMKGGLDKKCVILPNSVSPEFNRERFTGVRPHTIFTVGRMDENKNQEMAVRAFARIHDKHPESELVLIGDGVKRQYLEDLCTELSISEAVHFTGLVSDVPDRLERAYIYVLTSMTEGMPNTLLEAMALGTACISTDCPCGGPYDLIDNGVNGILVPVGDVGALSIQLDRLLDDPDLTESLGCSAYETMKDYRADAVNLKWRSFFESIICS